MSWEKVKLGDVCKIGDGAHASLKRLSHGIPYLTAKNLTRNGIDVQNLDFIDETTYNKHFKESSTALTRPQKNDILYSIIGSIGGVYLVKDEKIGISSSVAIFRSNPSILISKYLYYYLKSSLFDSQIQAIKGGVAQGFMSLSKLSSIEISYPLEIKTQKRIADILSAYDDLIENNQKQIKLLEEAAQRLYKHWFIDLRFPGHETTPIVDGIPQGWRKECLGNLVPILTGKKDANYGTADGKYPFFTCSQEPIKSPGYSFDTSAVILAGNGDFNVKLYRGKFEAYQRTYVLVPKDKNYLYLVYNSVQGKMRELFQGASGSTIKFLTKGMIESIPIVIPSNLILKKFNDLQDAVQKKIEVLKTSIICSVESRDRLLPKLMCENFVCNMGV